MTLMTCIIMTPCITLVFPVVVIMLVGSWMAAANMIYTDLSWARHLAGTVLWGWVSSAGKSWPINIARHGAYRDRTGRHPGNSNNTIRPSQNSAVVPPSNKYITSLNQVSKVANESPKSI